MFSKNFKFYKCIKKNYKFEYDIMKVITNHVLCRFLLIVNSNGHVIDPFVLR